MATFNATTVPFTWVFGGNSHEFAGFDEKKSSSKVVYESDSAITLKGKSFFWGEQYKQTTTYLGEFGIGESGSISQASISFGRGRSFEASNIQGVTMDDLLLSLNAFNEKYLANDDIINGSKKQENWINGRNGDDNIFGGNKDDFIYGGNGDDFLAGYKGLDFLSGGAGADIFVVDKKMGKGEKNYAWIDDFEPRVDLIYLPRPKKRLSIVEDDGNDLIVFKDDILAVVSGQGGNLGFERVDGRNWIVHEDYPIEG